jgi:hypothetical protein
MPKNKVDPNHFVLNQCDDGRELIALAKRCPRAEVRQNGSSHTVITMIDGEYKGDGFCIPDHELGVGLACKAWKWLVKVGIIASAIMLFGYLLITYC